MPKQLTTTEYVPVSKISVVWANSQRPMDEKFVERLATSLDPDKLGAPVLTKANGHGIYHVVDGQHRIEAIRRAFGATEKVGCTIVNAEDPAKAAQIFADINGNRKAVTQIDMFRVKVTACAPLETAVNRIVISNGLKVAGGNTSRGIACVGSLKRAYSNFGAEVLDGVLKILRAAWDMDPNSRSAPIVSATAAFLGEYRDQIDPRHLASVMSKMTPGKLETRILGARESMMMQTPAAGKAVLLSIYNKSAKRRIKKT